MVGRNADGHWEQTEQLSSLGSIIDAHARQRKPPINREKIGGEVDLLHQRANNIAPIFD